MKPLNYLGFRDEEMSIRVTPFLKNGKWTGDVHLAVDVFDTSPLDDTDYYSLMNLVQMMMSTPALIEQDELFRDKLWALVQKELDSKKKNGKVISRRDNIININFKGDTDGEA
tara:strand:- start:1088 stop:1426 length:339 start_codon:yes stop_codon:yes gene_type:complete